MPHALIVEDDQNNLASLSAILQADGFSVDIAASVSEARAALARIIPDVVLVDLNLPDGKGLDLLQHLPQQPPDGQVPIIVMTGNATVESAIEALRHGIWDYLLKPISIPRLRSLLARIPRPYELTEEVRTLRAELRRLGRYGQMVGRAPAMQRVYDVIERIAQTETPLLIQGEPGVGKAIAARTLHEMSRRRKGPFVRFDCTSAADDRPFAERLFGTERDMGSGAPGADARGIGALEAAAGGTLLLDEVVKLPLDAQRALLAALQSRTFRRVGGSIDLVTDFRIVAATSDDLGRALDEGRLLPELYERLAMTMLPLPPLRDRLDDVPLLAIHFVDEFNREQHAQKQLDAACLREFEGHDWPGNVRELRTRLERAHRLSDGVIDSLHDGDAAAGRNGSSVQVTVGTPLALVEELLIRATLDAVGGTRHRAASMLGISPKTLYNKLQRMKETQQ